MKPIKISTSTTVEVTIGGNSVSDIIRSAADLAHAVLEELSLYRQKHDLDIDTFDCEGEACAFLDMIGD